MQWLKSPGCIPLWVIKDVTLSLGKHGTTGFHCEHHMPSEPVYAIQELLGWQLETNTARRCLAYMLGALSHHSQMMSVVPSFSEVGPCYVVESRVAGMGRVGMID